MSQDTQMHLLLRSELIAALRANEPDTFKQGFLRKSAPVTARKDDAPAAVQAAIVTVAGLGSCSIGGGLIQTTSG
jgi:hypothetical protein